MTTLFKAISYCSSTALLVLLASTSTAQVYQTSDDKGNPVFSDKPSADATEVDLQQTNTTKSIDVPPPPPKQEQAAPAHAKPAQQQQNTEQTEQLDRYIVNNRDDNNGRETHRPERPSVQPHPNTRPARPAAKGR